MNRFRALAVSLSLAASGLMPLVVGQQAACAATADSAALVVDTGGSVADYCVELGSGSVSGIDLIKLASQQYGLSYNLGFGGKAVCALNGVGVTASGDCFANFPDYWGYWIGDGSGGWSWSSVGADSVTVSAGDVQGWAYGSGKDGSSHPQPPTTRYEDVCKVKDPGGSGDGDGSKDTGGSPGGDKPKNTDRGTQDPANDGGTSGGTDNQDGSDNPSNRSSNGGEGGGQQRGVEPAPAGRATPTPEAAPFEASPVVLAAPGGSGSGGSNGGPPAAGLAVLLAVLVLGMAGAYMTQGRCAKHRAGAGRTNPRA